MLVGLSALNQKETYRGFPKCLHHEVPHWVEEGALFHIRITLDRPQRQQCLTTPPLASAILNSVRFYESQDLWRITIFLLMPDHLHTIVSFGRDKSMSEVVRNWKRFHRQEPWIIDPASDHQ